MHSNHVKKNNLEDQYEQFQILQITILLNVPPKGMKLRFRDSLHSLVDHSIVDATPEDAPQLLHFFQYLYVIL